MLDEAGRPRAGAEVVVHAVDDRGRPHDESLTLEPVGELGIVHGRLPLPEEVGVGGRAGREPLRRDQTDAQGLVELRNLPPGRMQLSARHLGQSASAEVVVWPEGAGTLAAAVVLRLRPLVPSPGAPTGEPEAVGSWTQRAPVEPTAAGEPSDISGQVIDERGLPLARVRIEAQAGALRRHALSDASGGFALMAVPAGAVTLLLTHPGFAPLSLHLDEAKRRAPLRLQLLPGGGIEGLLRQRRLGGPPERARLVAISGSLRLPISLQPDGRFRVTGLPAGDITLRAEAPGFAPLQRRLQLPPAERPDEVTLRDLVLEMEVAGTVSGTVRDGRGAVDGAVVRVLDEQGVEWGRARSDVSGRFRIDGLPPGTHRIEARSTDGGVHSSVEVRGGDEVDIDLEIR
ncbi:MAG: carboxypeptidase-like regulatory domain-containing protein [Myxococcales bacterium]|nr:carboxypeptidase-like regulatory domain-containing protein [Myxococcota bacterium]MDW8283804.1 carboxypeptidase-like regulatory domain-containing protein [Myxococcales bacterium]